SNAKIAIGFFDGTSLKRDCSNAGACGRFRIFRPQKSSDTSPFEAVAKLLRRKGLQYVPVYGRSKGDIGTEQVIEILDTKIDITPIFDVPSGRYRLEVRLIDHGRVSYLPRIEEVRWQSAPSKVTVEAPAPGLYEIDVISL